MWKQKVKIQQKKNIKQDEKLLSLWKIWIEDKIYIFSSLFYV